MQTQSNYVLQLIKWQEEFREKGREIISAHGYYKTDENDRLKLKFFGTYYELDLNDGLIYIAGTIDECPLPPMCKMLMYSHLFYLKKGAYATKNMVGSSALKGSKFMRSGGGSMSPPCAEVVKKLDSDRQSVKDAVIRLGGEIDPQGDVSFSLYAFEDVRYTYIYYEGDDEFPSSIKIMFEENLLDFIQEEGAMMLGDMGYEFLCKELDLPYRALAWEAGLCDTEK